MSKRLLFNWMTFALGVLLLSTRAVDSAGEAPLTAAVLKKLTFDQKLGSQVSVELTFRDEQNRSTTLKDCLTGGPAILILGYYECPMLCNLVLNGVVESLQEIKPAADSGAQVIFVSIDPQETPELARAKKHSYLKRLGRPGNEQRWHFLCGGEPEIAQLAREVGFHFRYDSSHHQFAHPSGIVVLTPNGRISRYFLGVSYAAAELRTALADASLQRTGSPVQQLLILCSQFVPLTGKFSGTIMGAVRVVAIATVLAIVGIAFFNRRSGEGARREGEGGKSS